MKPFPAHTSAHGGFTLVEILVALGIFSIIALASFRLLSSTASFVQSREGESIERIEQQRGIGIFVSDLRHAIVLPLENVKRGNEGSNDFAQAAMLGNSEEFSLVFNRGDYFNAATEANGSNVQVRYELRSAESTSGDTSSAEMLGDDLIRIVSRGDDENRGRKNSQTQVLLTNVTKASLRFLSTSDQWTNHWPLQTSQSDRKGHLESNLLPGFHTALPVAVELMLEVGDQNVRKLIGLKS